MNTQQIIFISAQNLNMKKSLKTYHPSIQKIIKHNNYSKLHKNVNYSRQNMKLPVITITNANLHLIISQKSAKMLTAKNLITVI